MVQAVQLPAPAVALYVPAPHGAHASPSAAAVCPAMHTQSVSWSLPAPDIVLAGHAKQSPDPTAVLYVPTSHAEQTSTTFHSAWNPEYVVLPSDVNRTRR